jgi:hypothetical protein
MIVAPPLYSKDGKCSRKNRGLRAVRELRGGGWVWENEGMKERFIKVATESVI